MDKIRSNYISNNVGDPLNKDTGGSIMNYSDFAVLGLMAGLFGMMAIYEWGLSKLRRQLRENGLRPRV